MPEIEIGGLLRFDDETASQCVRCATALRMISSPHPLLGELWRWGCPGCGAQGLAHHEKASAMRAPAAINPSAFLASVITETARIVDAHGEGETRHSLLSGAANRRAEEWAKAA